MANWNVGPPNHKPFCLTIVPEDGKEQLWYLLFTNGPQFDGWDKYYKNLEKITDDILQRSFIEKMYGEHQLYFFEKHFLWGYYCPKVKNIDIPLLLKEWKKVWKAADFESMNWIQAR